MFSLSLSLYDCQAQKSAPPLNGYDLSAPTTMTLPDKIDEISGMAWNEADKSIYAIDDNEGRLFRIAGFPQLVVEDWEIGKSKDFEDLVITGGRVYILESKGNLLSFPLPKPEGEPLRVKLALDGSNEFESLYNDGRGHLILLCKSCKDDKKGRNSAYSYDLTTGSFSAQPLMVMDSRDAEALKSRFKPSAAAVNPVTGEVFLLSSVNKLLVVADAQLRIKSTHVLDPAVFKQPEGICFSPNGDLYISNEAAGAGPANILLFRRK